MLLFEYYKYDDAQKKYEKLVTDLSNNTWNRNGILFKNVLGGGITNFLEYSSEEQYLNNHPRFKFDIRVMPITNNT